LKISEDFNHFPHFQAFWQNFYVLQNYLAPNSLSNLSSEQLICRTTPLAASENSFSSTGGG